MKWLSELWSTSSNTVKIVLAVVVLLALLGLVYLGVSIEVIWQGLLSS